MDFKNFLYYSELTCYHFSMNFLRCHVHKKDRIAPGLPPTSFSHIGSGICLIWESPSVKIANLSPPVFSFLTPVSSPSFCPRAFPSQTTGADWYCFTFKLLAASAIIFYCFKFNLMRTPNPLFLFHVVQIM